MDAQRGGEADAAAGCVMEDKFWPAQSMLTGVLFWTISYSSLRSLVVDTPVLLPWIKAVLRTAREREAHGLRMGGWCLASALAPLFAVEPHLGPSLPSLYDHRLRHQSLRRRVQLVSSMDQQCRIGHGPGRPISASLCSGRTCPDTHTQLVRAAPTHHARSHPVLNQWSSPLVPYRRLARYETTGRSGSLMAVTGGSCCSSTMAIPCSYM